MKKGKVFMAAIGVIVVAAQASCNGKEVLDKLVSAVENAVEEGSVTGEALNKLKGVAADESVPPELAANWSSAPTVNLTYNFWMNSGSVSATFLNLTSAGRYTLTSVEGAFGMERNEISKGTFKVYSKLQMIEMTDEFDDLFYRNKYVLSETEDERILKLKNDDTTVLTFYADKPKQ